MIFIAFIPVAPPGSLIGGAKRGGVTGIRYAGLSGVALWFRNMKYIQLVKKRALGSAETSKLSRNFKAYVESPQENFCGYTLYFGLKHLYRTDHILACAALEFLITSQHLSKFSISGKIFKHDIFWLRMPILHAIFTKTKWETFTIL